jgi:hypothetical protein
MRGSSLGVWEDNLFTMKQPKAFPDDLGGLRNKIHELQKDIGELREAIASSRWRVFWRRVWAERNWSIAVIAVLVSGFAAGIWYIGNLILTATVQSALTTSTGAMQTDVRRIDGDVQQLKLMLRVIQNQIAAQKYLTVPPKELKAHTQEIKQLKNNFQQVPVDAPGYWPAAFQLITLLSQANSDPNIVDQRESSYDNVSSNPVGIITVANRRVVLRNTISGLVFENSIVRFDPSVRLVNDVFINCVFIFPGVQEPSKPLQEIGKALLAADLAHVTLNAS